MFVIIILVIVAFVVRHAFMNDSSLSELLKILLNEPTGSLPAVHHKQSSTSRSMSMAHFLEANWDEFFPDTEDTDFVFPTIFGRMNTRFFGPMDMNIAGDQVLIYDMWLAQSAEMAEQAISHTVISIKPPSINLPPFKLRSRAAVGIRMPSVSTVSPIKTETALDALYDIESMAPHRTSALFQSPLGVDVLVPFLLDQEWTVEWTGDRLLVYKLNCLIDPDRIGEVALEVSEFFELLKSGPAAIEAAMRELFRSTKHNSVRR